jgi:uroporphyrinogen-III synthase
MNNKKTIIVTKAQTADNSFEKHLQDKGFTVLSFPTIEISYQKPIFDFKTLKDYTHFIFTSQNGVIGFFQNIDKTPLPTDIQIVTIGKKTAKTVEQFGYKSQIISKGNTTEDLAQELRNEYLKKTDSILLIVGKKAGIVIEQTLQNFCSITRIEVYDTQQPQSFPQETLDAISTECFDLVAFTSPSTFENFITTTKISPEKLIGKIACIGTTTAGKVTELGFEPNLISSSANLEVFASEIIGFLSN